LLLFVSATVPVVQLLFGLVVVALNAA